jgi:hypothetical protein
LDAGSIPAASTNFLHSLFITIAKPATARVFAFQNVITKPSSD